MIKICGLVVMALGSYAFTQTSNLWFAQAGLIGVFFYFSEAIFELVTKDREVNTVEVGIKNAQPKYGWAASQ